MNCNYDASGILQQPLASHKRASLRCRGVHQYRTVQRMFRSSKSSNGCKKIRDRKCRIASHKLQFPEEDL